MSNRLPQLAAQHYVIGQPYRNEESYDTTTHRPHVRMWVTGERPCHMTPDDGRMEGGKLRLYPKAAA